MRWFRAYEEAVNDPKIQRLPDAVFKMWFNLLCLASMNNGVLPAVDSIAFSLRLSEAKCDERLRILINAGLIDENETGLSPHNWSGRQYKSDVSTDRVKQFRKRHGNVSPTVSETRPETETETETEKKEEPIGSSVRAKERGSRVPEDFWPNETSIAKADRLSIPITTHLVASFLDYWRSIPGAKGRRLDWQGTFRNFLDLPSHRKAQNGTVNGKYNTRDSIEQAKAFRRFEDAQEGSRDGSDEDSPRLPGLRQGSA